MQISRIPDFTDNSHEGMSIWFAQMAERGLLFHPEDRSCDIVSVDSGERMFSPDECSKLDEILGAMFDRFGDAVCEAAYPIFMVQAGLRIAA